MRTWRKRESGSQGALGSVTKCGCFAWALACSRCRISCPRSPVSPRPSAEPRETTRPRRSSIAEPARTKASSPAHLFHRDALGEVPRLVRIVAAEQRQVVSEELGGHRLRERGGRAEV